MRFVHDTLPQRVCFGSGEAAAHLTAQVASLGASSVMLIAAKADLFKGISSGVPDFSFI